MSERTFLIVGLGNPGTEYARTRHNIGFDIADLLVEQLGGSFEDKRFAFAAECKLKGKKVVVIKPTTYMNLSGRAVLYWMKELNIQPSQILIIADDINLGIGKIRIKGKGSDGGHNGLRNIQELLGSVDYPRLRFGAGNNFPPGKQVHYVLGKWEKDEEPIINERIVIAAEAIKSCILEGMDTAMNRFNS
jgi:PTH1 family peptidyl-tRNA hydrolase